MKQPTVYIQRLAHAKNLPLPAYMTEGSAGMDLYAAVEQDFLLHPGKYTLVPTGVKIALPVGYEAQIRPRSGLAYKHGITILNTPGTIDADYRGEIKVILINLGENDYVINRGDRIAQMVVQKIEAVYLYESDNLPATERNDGGFGHTD